jgi:hypothetical protein
MDTTEITAAAIIGLSTGVGAPIWSTAIVGVIQTVKAVPQFARLIEGREKLLAFILSALAVALSFVAALTTVPPAAVVTIPSVIIAVMAWFTLARLAMALHDDFARKTNSLTGPTE